MSTPARPPAINENNHGPQIVLAGAVMLAATVLMVVIAGYNRWNAKTLLRIDSPMLLLGGALDVAFYALCIVLVNHGYGRHVTDLTEAQNAWLKKMFLGSLIVYFIAQCAVKMSYNTLARQTARSKTYHWVIDGFSGFILLWTLSNIVVIAVNMRNLEAPSGVFFLVSGGFSIAIVVGQLLAFLWIIWRTSAPQMVKVRWTISIGAFVPICIAAIIARLVYTPRHYFGGDWTFTTVPNLVLFLIDMHIVTITILAPNLPVFFAKASTGHLHFVPGDAITTRNGSRTTGPSGSFAMKSATNRSTYSERAAAAKPYAGGRETVISTTIQHSEPDKHKRKSFDSDVIMLRRSVEMTDSEGPLPVPYRFEPEERSQTSRSQASY